MEFSTDIVPGIIIDADAVRYAQVLINLLSNALKYTAKGNVSLSLRRGEKLAELLISDSGEGIALEVVKNINSRSAQSFKSVNSKGVGLYIAKLIIDKHGWALHIDSEINVGTRMRVTMT